MASTTMRFLVKSGIYRAKNGEKYRKGDVITTEEDLTVTYGKQFERVANFTIGKNERREDMEELSEEEYAEKVKLKEEKSEPKVEDVTEDFPLVHGYTVQKLADSKGKDIWTVSHDGAVITKDPLKTPSAVNKLLKDEKKRIDKLLEE